MNNDRLRAIAIEQGAKTEIFKDNSIEIIFLEADLRAFINAVNAEESEAVAYLKFYSHQYLISADFGMDLIEGFEVCNKDDLSVDGSPAFPVYLHPPTLPADVVAYIKQLEDALHKTSKANNEGLVKDKGDFFTTRLVAKEALVNRPAILDKI